MNNPPASATASATETRTGVLAVAAAVAVCCLLASAQPGDRARLPYVWPSVAAAYFLGALPAGMLAAGFLRKRLSRFAALLTGLIAFLFGVLAMFMDEPVWQVPGGWLTRTSLALLVATGSLLVCQALLSQAGRDRATGPRISPPMIALGLVFATVVPSLYLESRCEYHRQRLADLLGQFRLGPALQLADQLNAISPRQEVNGLWVSRIATDLQAAVAEIESQIAQALPSQATPDERVERARQLAILGRVGETERVLAPLVQPAARNPQACNLLGLAYEGSQQWRDSLYWYNEAERILSGGTGGEVRDDLLQAIMGIAYAQRKLGHYREAEVAYQRCLELDSSAAMNFLMAQFYEDAQQATKAQQHAALAMTLDPARYQVAGRALIDQLETNHFGCLSVFLRRRSTGAQP